MGFFVPNILIYYIMRNQENKTFEEKVNNVNMQDYVLQSCLANTRKLEKQLLTDYNELDLGTFTEEGKALLVYRLIKLNFITLPLERYTDSNMVIAEKTGLGVEDVVKSLNLLVSSGVIEIILYGGNSGGRFISNNRF